MAEEDKKLLSESEWARFALNRPPSMMNQSGQPEGGHEAYPHHAPYNPDELFGQEQRKEIGGADTPWWKANFFIKEPILFGTWDGVFTSVMINIFGVIVFLKTGWMVVSIVSVKAAGRIRKSLSLKERPTFSSISTESNKKSSAWTQKG